MSKNRTDYICKQLGIKLRKYDPSPNRIATLRYSDPEDCVIRAICKVTDGDYIEIYNSILKTVTENYLLSMTYVCLMIEEFEKRKCFAKRIKKMTLGEFMHKHKVGKYAISVRNHVIPYINGTWYDIDTVLKDADKFLTLKVEFIICEEKYFKYL